MCSYLFFFFFSSRRRHTRYWRDWSSDVCSSDLLRRIPFEDGDAGDEVLLWSESPSRFLVEVAPSDAAVFEEHLAGLPFARSEERRVGKECRSRWSPYH